MGFYQHQHCETPFFLAQSGTKARQKSILSTCFQTASSFYIIFNILNTQKKLGVGNIGTRCKNLIIWSNCSSLGGFCSGVILPKEMQFLRQRRSDRWFRMWMCHPPQEEEKLTHYIFIQKNFWSIWVVLNVSFNHRLSTLKVDTQIYSQVFISRIRLIKLRSTPHRLLEKRKWLEFEPI